MEFNQSLLNFLDAIFKEKSKSVYFITSAGIINGTFESYDKNKFTTTISNPILNRAVIGKELIIPADAIQAWGK